jgi:hypothetical protein
VTDEERFTASRTIAAPAADIFRVISDPRGHVAIDASGMLQSAPGTKPVEKVGDSFVVKMDREALGDFPLGKYEAIVVITKLEPDRLIEWTIEGNIKPPIGHLYGYELAPGPEEGTTLVTSYYDWSTISDTWREAKIFPVIPQTALRQTLGILDRVVTRNVPLDPYG